ncbi:38485_t:CDS:2, partial [Gigaspora margarita]
KEIDIPINGIIDDKHQNNKAIVLIEAPLNMVIKMDTMMESLLKMLKR